MEYGRPTVDIAYSINKFVNFLISWLYGASLTEGTIYMLLKTYRDHMKGAHQSPRLVSILLRLWEWNNATTNSYVTDSVNLVELGRKSHLKYKMKIVCNSAHQ